MNILKKTMSAEKSYDKLETYIAVTIVKDQKISNIKFTSNLYK